MVKKPNISQAKPSNRIDAISEENGRKIYKHDEKHLQSKQTPYFKKGN